MERAKKPTLGVMPKYLWDELRRDDLAQAIYLAAKSGSRILTEWTQEYNEIVARLEQRK